MVCYFLTPISKQMKKSYLIRQYNIYIFDKVNVFKYRTKQLKATETNR